MTDWNTIEGIELNVKIARLLGYHVIRNVGGESTRYLLVSLNPNLYLQVSLTQHDDEESAWADAPNFSGDLALAKWLRGFVSDHGSYTGYNFVTGTTPDRNAICAFRPPSPYGLQREYSAEAPGESDDSLTLASCRLVGMLLEAGIINALPR